MPWSKININQNEYSKMNDVSDNVKTSHEESILDAFDISLNIDSNVIILGQGVNDHTFSFGTTKGLEKKYGKDRVQDTPLSENGMMGICTGLALNGFRPIYIHNRPDFLFLLLDQLINHSSKYSYMFGGELKVPCVIWTAIGRGWGTGAQHSQSVHSILSHYPGIKVVMPSTAYDSKGLILSSVADNNPVIVLEHRWLLKNKGYFPKEKYFVPLGKGIIRKEGKDITVVGSSFMIAESYYAALELDKINISAEIIDVRTIKPLDTNIIMESVKKTGRLCVVDYDHPFCSFASEVISFVVENGFKYLKEAPIKICLSDCPVPASHILEKEFYKDRNDIFNIVKNKFYGLS